MAPIGNGVLTGMDFLRNKECVMDITNGSLELGGMVLPLRETAEGQWSCQATVVETVCIPPGTETSVAGSLEDGAMALPCGIIGPAQTLANRSRAMVAPSVVSTDAEVMEVRVMNPRDRQVLTLRKGTTTAVFSSVDATGPEFAMSDDCTTEENDGKEGDTAPSHFQDWYQESSKLPSYVLFGTQTSQQHKPQVRTNLPKPSFGEMDHSWPGIEARAPPKGLLPDASDRRESDPPDKEHVLLSCFPSHCSESRFDGGCYKG